MNSKLRILHLGSPSGLYGAERWIVSLITYLDPEKIDSTVCVINDMDYPEIPLCKLAESRGIRSVAIDGFGKVNLGAVKRLREYIVANRVDILHTHFYKVDLIGLLAACGTSCRVVSTPHGWANRSSLSLWVYESVSKCFLPFMDAVVPLSKGIVQSLERIPGLSKKLHLIENAVDVSEASQDCEVADELEELRSQGKFILGYIGRFETGKDLKTLFLAMVGDRNPDWHAVLVGEGNYRHELEQLAVELGIEERVNFYGFREDRLSFLKGLDVFVLPSRSEGIPRCLMESMAARIPIVASDIPGCRDLVDGTTTGLLFPVGDAEALHQRLTDLQRCGEMRVSLAEEARRFVEKRFSCTRMANEYEVLYRKLVPEREEG